MSTEEQSNYLLASENGIFPKKSQEFCHNIFPADQRHHLSTLLDTQHLELHVEGAVQRCEK
jgi:hypothetical protein